MTPARSATAQEAPRFASPFLPAGHWVHAALRRLHGLALLPRGYDPSTRAITRREAGRLLGAARSAATAEAARRLAGGEMERGDRALRLARAYERRFAEEFPATAAALGRPQPPEGTDPPPEAADRPDVEATEPPAAERANARLPLEGSAALGARLRRNAALASHWRPDPTAPDPPDGELPPGSATDGPVPLSDRGDPLLWADLALVPPPGSFPVAARVAAGYAAPPHGPAGEGSDAATGAADGGEDATAAPRATLHAAYAVLQAGELALWAGRHAPGFGPGYAGTIALSGVRPVDGAGVALTDGATLPWIFRYLGLLRFEAFGARLPRSGPILHPWLFGFHVSIAPAPGLRLAINRAGMFGGENHPVPTTFSRVVNAVVGAYSATDGDNYENQMASGEMWLRLPRGAPPLSFYLEWGFEDWAGAWVENPGLVFGTEWAALPGLPEVSVGLEGARFAPPDEEERGSMRVWYRHGTFADNWTVEGRPLGHPLGGEGWEARLRTRADLDAARLRLRAHLLRRDRGATNLYAPDAEGTSTGLGGGVAWRTAPSLEVFARGQAEWGRGGSAGSAAGGLRAFF